MTAEVLFSMFLQMFFHSCLSSSFFFWFSLFILYFLFFFLSLDLSVFYFLSFLCSTIFPLLCSLPLHTCVRFYYYYYYYYYYFSVLLFCVFYLSVSCLPFLLIFLSFSFSFGICRLFRLKFLVGYQDPQLKTAHLISKLLAGWSNMISIIHSCTELC